MKNISLIIMILFVFGCDVNEDIPNQKKSNAGDNVTSEYFKWNEVKWNDFSWE